MKAGRELDRRVNTALGFEEKTASSIGDGYPIGLPHYSTDIASAWLVVEKMRELGWRMLLENWVTGSDTYVAFFRPENRYRYETHIGVTDEAAPITICRAALKTVGAE